jgi:hypothetical protein
MFEKSKHAVLPFAVQGKRHRVLNPVNPLEEDCWDPEKMQIFPEPSKNVINTVKSYLLTAPCF